MHPSTPTTGFSFFFLRLRSDLKYARRCQILASAFSRMAQVLMRMTSASNMSSVASYPLLFSTDSITSTEGRTLESKTLKAAYIIFSIQALEPECLRGSMKVSKKTTLKLGGSQHGLQCTMSFKVRRVRPTSLSLTFI